ncbi:MAG TPA: molybdenum cofactor biosynthesis protein B [Acidobacteriota bacterium]|nr:molybdenum cofactor biosynthesis protein B [Acidobacteriota bacterium]
MKSKAGPASHQEQARLKGPVRVAVITVSDTRSPEDDTNGKYLQEQINEAGHELCAYRVIPDEPDRIERTLNELSELGCEVLLFNGGTGISRRDTTYDVLAAKLEKTLTGFGEIFRMLSYQEIGPAAMLSRAAAGTYRNSIVISVPGSPKAVKLAWEKLIAPEIQHLAWELTR